MNYSIRFFFISLCLFSVTFAQTTIPGGYVSGTWTESGSPYLIQGSITIHADSTLSIEPGVQTVFQGDYCLTVNGYLEAIGAEADSIHFWAQQFSMTHMVLFVDAPDSSRMTYCTFVTGEGYSGSGGIRCTNSNPVLTHSSFRHCNSVTNSGAALYLDASNPTLIHCNFIGNETFLPSGGAIYCTNSAPDISFCTFSGNTSHDRGGAIYSTGNSNLSLFNCVISNNVASYYGNGIYATGNSILFLSDCTISDNVEYADWGGGIYANGNTDLSLSNCTISGNMARYKGGGIFAEGAASLNLTNCSIYNNWIDISSDDAGGGIAYLANSTCTISECTFSQNRGGDAGGGGVWIAAGSAYIDRSTFYLNYTSYLGPGGAIYADCDTLLIDHCTFDQNHCGVVSEPDLGQTIHAIGSTVMGLSNNIINGVGIGCAVYANSTILPSIQYNNSDDNSYGPYAGTLPPDLLVLTTVNVNGDSCDVYGNFDMNPQIVNSAGGNFHLQETSACIDAGDPAFAYDPDSTITDMGRYYYDQSPPGVPSAITDLTISCDTLNVYLLWSPVTTDTSGISINVSQYIIYASDDPFFTPTSTDSIGFTTPPDTSYTDIDALTEPKIFYNVKVTVGD